MEAGENVRQKQKNKICRHTSVRRWKTDNKVTENILPDVHPTNVICMGFEISPAFPPGINYMHKVFVNISMVTYEKNEKEKAEVKNEWSTQSSK